MYELTIATAFCDILFDDKVPARVRNLRLDTLEKIFHILKFYASQQVRSDLLNTIAEKKRKLLLQITKTEELKKLGNPPCPRSNGAELVADPLLVPEEELVLWSLVSKEAPLQPAAFHRYMKLVRQILPEAVDG